MKFKGPLYFLSVLSIFYANTLFAQITPANNIIAVDVSTYHVQNGTSNYDSTFSIGYNLGMRQVGLFLNWTMLEPAPNTYDFSLLDIANIYYPASNMAVDININPINTNKLEVPADLVTLALDDAQLISRYKIILDSAKVHMPAITISSMIIGSEIGAYLGNDAVKWAQYTNFYEEVGNYAKTLWPGLKVAVELQFGDIMNYGTFAQQINNFSDYIGVSYYPLWPDFTVKPTWIVAFDMDTLIDMYPNKPICFYQFGYPSSPFCASSDSLQADFIHQAFTYWDVFAANIKLIDFTWITDLDTAAVNYYATYYGLADTSFLEFLRTIGLRTWNDNGADKPALNVLRCEAQERGYNNLPILCGPTRVETKEKNDLIAVFPNPGKGNFNVQVVENGQLIMYDLMGKEILNKPVFIGINQLNADYLKPGIYYIKYQNLNGQINCKRLIIE